MFSISGVVDAGVQAYQVWFAKSPAYKWEEVITPVLNFLGTALGQGSPQPLPGSKIDHLALPIYNKRTQIIGMGDRVLPPQLPCE